MKSFNQNRAATGARAALAAACAAILTVHAAGTAPAGPPDGNGDLIRRYFGAAPDIAPVIAQGSLRLAPHALITYESAWRVHAVVPGNVLSYCVFPSITIQSPYVAAPPSPLPPWTTPFSVRLVDRNGSPIPGFAPVAVATVPIPANTASHLRPSPLWCGRTAAGAALPELYLKGEGRTLARVLFAPATGSPPSSSPR